MNFNNKIISCFFLALVFFASNTANAKNHSTVFFYSNNEQLIDLKHAFDRLMGKEQQKLEKMVTQILQQEHMEQGRFKNILGTYTMAAEGGVTADNSEAFFTSPLQTLSEDRIFSLALKLATSLNQESVAVFIPSAESAVGHVTLRFSPKPKLDSAIKLIKDKLPASYNQAFSLNLTPHIADYNLLTVNSIEWIGNELDLEVIKNSFPEAKINYQTGNSYLVYKNGERIKL